MPSLCSDLLRSFPDGEKVKVVVGTPPCRYYVHKSLLSKSFKVFGSLLSSGGDQDGIKPLVDFPNDESSTFNAFFDLMYTRAYKFPVINEAEEQAYHEDEDREKDPDQHTELVKLFCLAERFDCPEMKQCLINAVLDHHEDGRITANDYSLAMLYNGTSSDCELRKLYITQWVHEANEEYFSGKSVQRIIKNHAELAMDLIKEFVRVTHQVDMNQEQQRVIQSHPERSIVLIKELARVADQIELNSTQAEEDVGAYSY